MISRAQRTAPNARLFAFRALLGAAACLSSLAFGAEPAPAQPDSLETIRLFEVPPPSREELLDHPKNLARWHMGATMYDASGDYLNPLNWQETDSTESMGALMTDDPTARYRVDPGTHRFVIDLGEFFTIERFNFKNFTARGRVELYFSESLEPPEGKAWREAAPPVALTQEEVISPKFTPFEARYLMAELDITQAGDIGNLGAFGNLSVAEVRLKEAKRDEDIATDATSATNRRPVKLNYASASADSRVSYVSSGQAPASIAMIDDDVETFYQFDDEEENIVIIDLSQQRDVNSVSMLVDSGPGEFDFFVLNKLPDNIEKVIEEREKQLSESDPEPADDDMAMIFNQGRWEPLLLAQNGDAIGGIVNFASEAIFATVQIPGDFFANLSPTVETTVNGSEERFRIDFANLQGQYLIIRFIPAPGSGGVVIYEVSLMGDVPADDEYFEQIDVFQFAGDSLELGSEPTQPVVVPPPPPNVRPPPPVSP